MLIIYDMYHQQLHINPKIPPVLLVLGHWVNQAHLYVWTQVQCCIKYVQLTNRFKSVLVEHWSYIGYNLPVPILPW